MSYNMIKFVFYLSLNCLNSNNNIKLLLIMSINGYILFFGDKFFVVFNKIVLVNIDSIKMHRH